MKKFFVVGLIAIIFTCSSESFAKKEKDSGPVRGFSFYRTGEESKQALVFVDQVFGAHIHPDDRLRMAQIYFDATTELLEVSAIPNQTEGNILHTLLARFPIAADRIDEIIRFSSEVDGLLASVANGDALERYGEIELRLRNRIDPEAFSDLEVILIHRYLEKQLEFASYFLSARSRFEGIGKELHGIRFLWPKTLDLLRRSDRKAVYKQLEDHGRLLALRADAAFKLIVARRSETMTDGVSATRFMGFRILKDLDTEESLKAVQRIDFTKVDGAESRVAAAANLLESQSIEEVLQRPNSIALAKALQNGDDWKEGLSGEEIQKIRTRVPHFRMVAARRAHAFLGITHLPLLVPLPSGANMTLFGPHYAEFYEKVWQIISRILF